MVEDPVSFMREWCDFSGDRVYLLLGLSRPKENPSLTDNTKIAMRFVIRDEDDIEEKYERLKNDISRHDYTFRIYLTVNARDAAKASLNLSNKMNKWMEDTYVGAEDKGARKKFKRVDSEWKSEVARPQSKAETYFLFDLDDEREEKRDELVNDIEEGGGDVVQVLPSPNGWHIISDTFNYNNIETDIDIDLSEDIKKDGMLFLEMVN